MGIKMYAYRAGLVPMLYGLIRGLGKRFDLVVLDIQQLEEDKSVNGLVFKISW